MLNCAIEPATADDAAAILSLAAASGLPLDGLNALGPTTLVARQDGSVIGIAALELYGDAALLRSVAVDRQARGAGVGIRLTEAAIEQAARCGARSLYLLTTTAERFFPRFGFEPTTREDVPAAVRQSVEFVSACPASAIVMVRRGSESGV